MDTVQSCIKSLRQDIAPSPREKSFSSSVDVIDKLIGTCLSLLNAPLNHDHITFLEHEIHQAQKRVDEANRRRYTYVNKLSRAIEQAFPDKIDDFISPDLFRDAACEQALHQAVFDYLTRSGDGTIAKKFSETDKVDYQTFQDLNDDLKVGQLDRVRQWVLSHQDELKFRKSPLEYMLHRYEFLRLALGRTFCGETSQLQSADTSSTNVSMAFHFGRLHLTPYLGEHLAEIQQLFSLLVFLPHISMDNEGARRDEHPLEQAIMAQIPHRYRDLITVCDNEHSGILRLFRQDYCAIANIPSLDPLEISVNVGLDMALSRLVKVRKMMQQHGHEWSQADELPIEIPIPSALKSHSTFICPVSKDVATEENPPMRQPCGHVLCLETLQKMDQAQKRIKCPYCPAESKLSDACRLYF